MDKERNKRIYEEYRQGKSFHEIGRAYNLTAERIRQIVNREKRKRDDHYWVDQFPQQERIILIESGVSNEMELHKALESGKLILSKHRIATCNRYLKDPIVIKRKPHPRFVDLTGKKFGRLTAIERNGTSGGYVAWKCRCDCGNIVTVRGTYLTHRRTLSCGCWKRDRFKMIGKMSRRVVLDDIPTLEEFDSKENLKNAEKNSD